MEIKISIIIPVYNTEKFLRRCLDSVMGQSLEEIEIIAINDCSEDNCGEILKEYKEKYADKITIIENTERLFPGGARNIGLKLAKGEYIGFVDSDDDIDKKMYEKMYKAAKRADYDVFECGIYWELGKKETKTFFREVTGILDNEKRKLFIKSSGYIWSKIIKRKLIIDNEIYFRENVIFEDAEYMPLIIHYAKKFGATSTVLYNYRANAKSITNKIENNDYYIEQKVECMKALIERFRERGILEEYRDVLEYRVFNVYSNIIYKIMFGDMKLKVKIFEDLKSELKKLVSNFEDNQFIKEMDKKYIKVARLNEESSAKLLSLREEIIKGNIENV